MTGAAAVDLAHVAHPEQGSGQPVLIIHSWWGLTAAFTSYADQLAARGFLAGCADLYDGAVAESETQARRLRSRGREPAYRRLRRSLAALSTLDGTEGRSPAVVGFSMGGHWAVWLAQHPDPPVSAVVLYYAARGGDFSEATAPLLAHFAGADDFVSGSARRSMERAISVRGLPYTSFDYPGTVHWFAESDRPAFEPEAAGLAFDRTTSFLNTVSQGG